MKNNFDSKKFKFGSRKKPYHLLMGMIGSIAVLVLISCGPTPVPTPTVDAIGTMAATIVSGIRTQTASAPTPTPLPATETPQPTFTLTPAEPTWDPNNHTVVVIRHQAECWFGPGPSYNLESNISNTKEVELLGVGSISGWYIIKNPYFYQPCWIQAADIKVDPRMDLSTFPIISPAK